MKEVAAFSNHYRQIAYVPMPKDELVRCRHKESDMENRDQPPGDKHNLCKEAIAQDDDRE